MSKKETPKKNVCGICGGELIPSGCGCKNEKCENSVTKWPKRGTMYDPPKEPTKETEK